jgi:hypothetical protein
LIRHGLVVVISLICRIGHGWRGVIGGRTHSRINCILSLLLLYDGLSSVISEKCDECLGVGGFAYWDHQPVAMSVSDGHPSAVAQGRLSRKTLSGSRGGGPLLKKREKWRTRLKSRLGKENHLVTIGAARHEVRGGGEEHSVVTIGADGRISAEAVGLSRKTGRVGNR